MIKKNERSIFQNRSKNKYLLPDTDMASNSVLPASCGLCLNLNGERRRRMENGRFEGEFRVWIWVRNGSRAEEWEWQRRATHFFFFFFFYFLLSFCFCIFLPLSNFKLYHIRAPDKANYQSRKSEHASGRMGTTLKKKKEDVLDLQMKLLNK